MSMAPVAVVARVLPPLREPRAGAGRCTVPGPGGKSRWALPPGAARLPP
jgi:hypothetical protein